MTELQATLDGPGSRPYACTSRAYASYSTCCVICEGWTLDHCAITGDSKEIHCHHTVGRICPPCPHFRRDHRYPREGGWVE